MPDSKLLKVAEKRIVILDGAMGTNLQQRNLPLSDYRNHENCSEILTLTRPDVLKDIHRSFLAVGCDGVLTNTFGANNIVLGEFGLVDRVRELNREAARIAREACEEFARPHRPKFVIGSVGPGTRLPSLQHRGRSEAPHPLGPGQGADYRRRGSHRVEV